ncbi:hypothetical protein [Desulfonema magnum]|uniref:hypothetical protein n=1 Tax=Desulfonema magnum TaxID=45655 RepID=UPI001A9B4830|nr:hypothetical protein [Desulfonema magnum]
MASYKNKSSLLSNISRWKVHTHTSFPRFAWERLSDASCPAICGLAPVSGGFGTRSVRAAFPREAWERDC